MISEVAARIEPGVSSLRWSGRPTHRTGRPRLSRAVPRVTSGARCNARPTVPVELPVGTVSFLMTDIEGATRAWDDSPNAMRVALQLHDRLVKERIEKHNGQIVESGREGDSVLAAFRNAKDAVAGALDLQRALGLEAWPVGADIRVRMALHTGDSELVSRHYVGAALYRCARLMATAHGGQVVMSGATQELVSDGLPRDASLRDLGQYRLRDLSRPERVFQVMHPDLQSEFAPLRAEEKLHGESGAPRAEHGVEIVGELSKRELEVAGLVASGLTNREIAKKLFISERTAEGHVERIRNKLTVRSRTEVATLMVRAGLNPSLEGDSLRP
jgi:class 3 adenylate cyclase/DNA-binding CsgD family transcriptional regulator